MTNLADLLDDYSDPQSQGFNIWVAKGLEILKETPPDGFDGATFACVSVLPEKVQPFIGAALLADWASYAEGPDRVDLERLRKVTTIFPDGFQLWVCKIKSSERYLPVGYTGWYPIAEKTFDTLQKNPELVTDRGFMLPLPNLSAEGNYLYLFNYSIIEQFRKTPFSRQMMQNLAQQIAAIDTLGLAAVALSEDGIRIARRFGLDHSGTLKVQNEIEEIFTARVRSR